MQRRPGLLRRLIAALMGVQPQSQVRNVGAVNPRRIVPVEITNSELWIDSVPGDFGNLHWLYERSEHLARSIEATLILMLAIEAIAVLYVWDPGLAEDIASFVRITSGLILFAVPFLGTYLFAKLDYLIAAYLKTRHSFLTKLANSSLSSERTPLPYENVSLAFVLSTLVNRRDRTWNAARGKDLGPNFLAYFIGGGRLSYLIVLLGILLLGGINNLTILYYSGILIDRLAPEFRKYVPVGLLVLAGLFYFHLVLLRLVPLRKERSLAEKLWMRRRRASITGSLNCVFRGVFELLMFLPRLTINLTRWVADWWRVLVLGRKPRTRRGVRAEAPRALLLVLGQSVFSVAAVLFFFSSGLNPILDSALSVSGPSLIKPGNRLAVRLRADISSLEAVSFDLTYDTEKIDTIETQIDQDTLSCDQFRDPQNVGRLAIVCVGKGHSGASGSQSFNLLTLKVVPKPDAHGTTTLTLENIIFDTSQREFEGAAREKKLILP